MQEDKVPDELLPAEKMSEIIEDFHLLEGKIEMLRVPPDSARKVYSHFAPMVYERHEVDSVLYKESLIFYMDHPNLMMEIYEAVVDSLMVRNRSKDVE